MSIADPVGGFRHASAVHELHVLDRSSMTIRTNHTFELVAVRDERFFERNYQWTGSGIEKEPIVKSGLDALGHARHRLHGPVLRDGINRTFLVDLGRKIPEGESELLEIEHTFIDVHRTFEPFMGVKARLGCHELDIRVLLPVQYQGDVWSEEIILPGSVPSARAPVAPISTERNGIACKEYRSHVTRPAIGTSYRVVWQKQPAFIAYLSPHSPN